MSWVLLLLLVAPLVSAQTIRCGRCPTTGVQPDFDLQRYLGRWFEITKLPANFERGKCIEANYALREDGTIQVLNKQQEENGISIIGTARIPDPREPAKLGVSFSFGKVKPSSSDQKRKSTSSEKPNTFGLFLPSGSHGHVLGALHRLHQRVGGVLLHRLPPRGPHGLRLDLGAEPHPARRDHEDRYRNTEAGGSQRVRADPDRPNGMPGQHHVRFRRSGTKRHLESCENAVTY
uniref:Apolipoprotein D n=1 Tax=Neogobius melanostomus TaxID=47308 RepID=A0A8C6SBE5_9GOBI